MKKSSDVSRGCESRIGWPECIVSGGLAVHGLFLAAAVVGKSGVPFTFYSYGDGEVRCSVSKPLSDKEIEAATHNGIASDPSTRPFADWRAEKQREFERTN